MKPADFIAAVSPAARTSMARTKIPASFTIAQCALESGWATSKPAAEAMNLFNIKADSSWHGPTWRMASTEHINGKDVLRPANWRMYPDWLASIDDHATFLLTNPRYKPAFAHCDNGEAFAASVAAAGYATDPNYAAKLIVMIRSHNLLQFDKP